MIIIWMNIVFGIIIDTFAELRDAKKSKGFFYIITYLDEDQTNICFISFAIEWYGKLNFLLI